MEEKSMRKMMNKVAGSMKATAAKAVHLLKDKRGENYVDTAVKILIAVVSVPSCLQDCMPSSEMW